MAARPIMGGEFNSFDIDVLCAAEIEGIRQAKSAEYLRQVRPLGGIACIAVSRENALPKNAGVLGRRSCRDRRVVAGIGTDKLTPEVVGTATAGLIPSDAAGRVRGVYLIQACRAAPDHNRIATRDNPGAVVADAGVVVPHVAELSVSAVLVRAAARIGHISESIALSGGDVSRVARSTVGADVPVGSGSRGHWRRRDYTDRCRGRLGLDRAAVVLHGYGEAGYS